MKRLLDSFADHKTEILISVAKMEIDYELLTLYEALEDEDERLIRKTKARLETLRKKLGMLEG